MSGSRSRSRSVIKTRVVETCCPLDVNELHKRGFLRPGSLGALHWKSERPLKLELRAGSDRIALFFNGGAGPWEKVAMENIPIVRRPCPFGGTRPYFLCPGMGNGARCGRRVMKLYLSGRYFLCRHCHGLAYSSQREGQCDRAIRRARKAKHRLGGDSSLTRPLPPRPKGMWQSSYDQLCRKAIAAETIVFQILGRRFEHLLGPNCVKAGQLSVADGKP